MGTTTKEKKAKRDDDKSTWAIGGGLLLGIGAGFFVLTISPLAFVGCILGGLGLGLIITAILANRHPKPDKSDQ